jgi:hypothetical protein
VELAVAPSRRRSLLREFGLDIERFREECGRIGWGLVDGSGVRWTSPHGLAPPDRDDCLVNLLSASGASRGLYVVAEPGPETSQESLAGFVGHLNCRTFSAERAGSRARCRFLLEPLARLCWEGRESDSRSPGPDLA